MTDAVTPPGVLGLAVDLQPRLAETDGATLLVSTRGDQVRARAATRAAVLDGRSVIVVVHPAGAARAAELVLAGAMDVRTEVSLRDATPDGQADDGAEAEAGGTDGDDPDTATTEPTPGHDDEPATPAGAGATRTARTAAALRDRAAPTDDQDDALLAAAASLDGVHRDDAPLAGFVLGLHLDLGSALPRGVTSLLARRLRVHWQDRLGPDDHLVAVDGDRLVAVVHGDLDAARAVAEGWARDAADYAPQGHRLHLHVGIDAPEADTPLVASARVALDAAARAEQAGHTLVVVEPAGDPDTDPDRAVVEEALRLAHERLAVRRGQRADVGAATVRIALRAALRCGLDDADVDRVVVAAGLHLLPPALVRNVHGDHVGRLLDQDVAPLAEDVRAARCLQAAGNGAGRRASDLPLTG